MGISVRKRCKASQKLLNEIPGRMQKTLYIALALILLGEIYTFLLIRSSLRPVASPGNAILFALYLLASALIWSSVFFFRQINWADLPHMPRNIFVAFAIGFIVAKLLVAGVMLLDDVRRLIIWLSIKIAPATKNTLLPTGGGITRSVFLKRLALIMGGTIVGGFLYGITNRYNYQVKKLKLTFKNLPASFRGLKIVQISDIHAGSFDSHDAVARGVAQVMDQKPDIIFFTGDLVNNKAAEIKPYIDIFSQLQAGLGIYSTLGNHDYGDYMEWPSPAAKEANLHELKSIHGQMGWKLLMNEHIVLERGEDKIAVIGVENWGARAQFVKYGNLRKAYAGLPEKNVPFRILLSHDPSHWDAEVINKYKDIDLTLSGHTHGMQFGIEIPGLRWSPIKYLYKNWAGLARENNQYLYVNRGYGFLGYPGRLGVLPEITVIELA